MTTDQALVLYGLADPGNVGSLIRTAAAFGAGVIAGPGTADPWSPKTLRAAAGGHFRTTIELAPDLDPAALEGAGLGRSSPRSCRGASTPMSWSRDDTPC